MVQCWHAYYDRNKQVAAVVLEELLKASQQEGSSFEASTAANEPERPDGRPCVEITHTRI
jgi:hypothetical protein